jgi:hypothetical protein
MAIDPTTGQDDGTGTSAQSSDWWTQNAPPQAAQNQWSYGPQGTSPQFQPTTYQGGGGTSIYAPVNASGLAANATAPQAGQAPTLTSSSSPQDAIAVANALIAKGGVPNTDGGAYWGTAWTQWGSQNPAYFLSKLQAAIAQQPGYNGSFGSNAGGGISLPGAPANFGQAPPPYASQPYAGAPYQVPPAAAATLATPFQAPTSLNEQNDPGYLARMQLGQTALEQSAAAKGSVLSGGFQKALNQYASDYASNEYSSVYNRALSTQQQNVNQAQDTIGNANTAYQNQYGAYLNENARTLSDYLTNFNTSNIVQTNYWNRLQQLEQQGLTAANQPGP